MLSPVKPPYDALEWERMPFAEKSRLVCLAWAMQGYGTPLAVYAAYALKVVLYCGEATVGNGLRLLASAWAAAVTLAYGDCDCAVELLLA